MERSGKINRKLGKLNTALNVYSIEIVLKYKMVDYKIIFRKLYIKETCSVHEISSAQETFTIHETCIVHETCNVHKTCTVHELCIVNELCTVH